MAAAKSAPATLDELFHLERPLRVERAEQLAVRAGILLARRLFSEHAGVRLRREKERALR